MESVLKISFILLLMIALTRFIDGDEVSEKRADAARVERVRAMLNSEPSLQDKHLENLTQTAAEVPPTDPDQH